MVHGRGDDQHIQKKSNEQISHKLMLLPDLPGCYLMKNKQHIVIYVGKAKVLKHRVRSYFTGSHNEKTQRLVAEINDFEYIVTDSNTEALILECNLIKKYQPRYNVLLKDDKTFPYLKITYEQHPRLEVTRRVLKDKAKYFGPYPNAYAAQQTKKLLDRMYPLRKCGTMPKEVCLYYHIGQCLAPCVQQVDAHKYNEISQEITSFLKGEHEQIIKKLRQKMQEAADNMYFERAKELREQITAIHTLMERQKITMVDAKNRDVFGVSVEKGWMCVYILYMRQGKMVERHASIFPFYNESYSDFMSYVSQYYSDNPALPQEILLPSFEEHDHASCDKEEVVSAARALQQWLGVKVYAPKRGLKRKMTLMAADNARVAVQQKFKLIEKQDEKTCKAAEELGKWIGMDTPNHIEAFDNSNTQGTHPVSTMVVFTNGKPNKKQYRKYKIRSVQGPDDYETMREVIRRRYERVLKEQNVFPDLIIVDGGRGQLSAASEVLNDELGIYIPVCGLVKDEKHKTSQLLIGQPPQIIPIPRDSQAFYFIQRIQDEVHRFALSFHRQQRKKSMVNSRLDHIKGIGEKRRKLLLSHFGSYKKIKEAQVEDFKPLAIGEKLAFRIIAALQEDNEGQE